MCACAGRQAVGGRRAAGELGLGLGLVWAACEVWNTGAGLTFFGGTMAMASFGGMEMWCGRESLSPFTDLRTNWSTLALVTA